MAEQKTVVVACKLPAGLVVTHGKVKRDGDGKPVVTSEGKVVQENEQTFFFKGTNTPGAILAGDPASIGTTGGADDVFALTSDVPADWFADWMQTHSEYAPVKNGSIVANANEDAARGRARERGKSTRSGFEKADPANETADAGANTLETAVRG